MVTLVVQTEAAVIAVDAIQNRITEGERMYCVCSMCREIIGSVWARRSAVKQPARAKKKKKKKKKKKSAMIFAQGRVQ